jgi:hypothetical protein
MKLGCLAVFGVLFLIFVIWTGGLLDAMPALAEYLRPTSVLDIYFPQDCIQTSDTPPLNLRRIVEDQADLNHLTVQRVAVCRSKRHLLGLEQRLTGLPSGEHDPCRPLLKGCCSCQEGRHVIVEVADPAADGSILVRADLIESRGNYLRRKLQRPGRAWWFWWWPVTGALLFVLAFRRI